jgi:TPR repeat protein
MLAFMLKGMKIPTLAVFLSLLFTGIAVDKSNQSSETVTPDEYWLGLAYANGISVEQNKTTAAMFFKISGLLGHGPSQRNLGIMHGLGDGVELDRVQAFAWLLIAQTNKDTEAPMALEDLAEDMNASEISAGRKLASDILSAVIASREKK